MQKNAVCKTFLYVGYQDNQLEAQAVARYNMSVSSNLIFPPIIFKFLWSLSPSPY